MPHKRLVLSYMSRILLCLIWVAGFSIGDCSTENIVVSQEGSSCHSHDGESLNESETVGYVMFQATQAVKASPVEPENSEAEESETQIEFTGDSHGERDVSHRIVLNPDSGLPVTMQLFRPIWQKSSRCSDGTETSCEECWSDVDCWDSFSSNNGNRYGGRRSVTSSNPTPWARWLNVIHLSCATTRITVKFAVDRIKRGILKNYWDGVEVTEAAAAANNYELNEDMFPFDSAGTKRGTQVFQVNSGSGHEWVVELTRSEGATKLSQAKFTQLEFYMRNDFAECEDTKACLQNLTQHHELRSSNELQISCLQGQDAVAFDDGCQEWLACLTLQKQEELLTLLLSTRVSAHGSLMQANATRILTKASPYTKHEGHMIPWMQCGQHGSEGNCGGPDVTEEGCAEQATVACNEDPECSGFAIRVLGKETYGSTYLTYNGESCIDQQVYSDVYWNLYRKASTQATPVEHCMDPAIEDAESWDCDCYPRMKAACDEINAGDAEPIALEDCFTAIFCEHPGVCDSWKTAPCQIAAVGEARLRLLVATVEPFAVEEDAATEGGSAATGTQSALTLLSKRKDQKEHDNLTITHRVSTRGDSDSFDGTASGKFCE